MPIFSGDLLGRCNVVSQKSIDIDLNVGDELYDSLIHYFSDLRNVRMFNFYEHRPSKLRGVGIA